MKQKENKKKQSMTLASEMRILLHAVLPHLILKHGALLPVNWYHQGKEV